MPSIAAASMSDHASNAALLTAALTDITSIRTQLVAAVADIAALITAHNTLATKLNADGGVTDTNYAAASAQTSTNPSALTLLV